jgi:hypothetical protein
LTYREVQSDETIRELPFNCEDANNKDDFDTAECKVSLCVYNVDSGMSSGAVIGIICGSVFGVILISVLFYYFCCRTEEETVKGIYDEL